MFFERHEGGERAVLVHASVLDDNDSENPREFAELASSAGVDACDFIDVTVRSPSPRFFVGAGKVEEIQQCVLLHKAEVVLFNNTLSPGQTRNLEKELDCRVIDRTALILDIFAQRARTFEGKLQVELAQLEYISTRLVRGWTHLERQKGGIGLRGPGESQLETDRRLLRGRIKSLTARLEKVRKQRSQGRRARQRSGTPQVALVGYTNAGKSTLFNRMTSADVYAEDQLFATLDPTLRRLELPGFGSVVLADTVGFIRHLPHKLVEAFRATLEETRQANLLLHVIDAHDSERQGNIEQVHRVLKEIDAEDVPILQIYNKIDLIDGCEPKIQRQDGVPTRVWVSAYSGEGVALIQQAVIELLGHDRVSGQLTLPADQGKIRSELYRLGGVVSEGCSDSGEFLLQISMSRGDLEKILNSTELPLHHFIETVSPDNSGGQNH